jgi:hypothetical protein
MDYENNFLVKKDNKIGVNIDDIKEDPKEFDIKT